MGKREFSEQHLKALSEGQARSWKSNTRGELDILTQLRRDELIPPDVLDYEVSDVGEDDEVEPQRDNDFFIEE